MNADVERALTWVKNCSEQQALELTQMLRKVREHEALNVLDRRALARLLAAEIDLWAPGVSIALEEGLQTLTFERSHVDVGASTQRLSQYGARWERPRAPSA